MRITIRHHFDFGADRAVVGDDLVRPQAWDALRTRTSGAFAISRDRAELERTADERPEIGERARQIDAWLEEQVSQCAYCINGWIMTAPELSGRNPKPTDAQIKDALKDLICRCGTHAAAIRAVKRATQQA